MTEKTVGYIVRNKGQMTRLCKISQSKDYPPEVKKLETALFFSKKVTVFKTRRAAEKAIRDTKVFRAAVDAIYGLAAEDEEFTIVSAVQA